MCNVYYIHAKLYVDMLCDNVYFVFVVLEIKLNILD